MAKRKNPHAVAMARKRARKLTAERRREIARMGGLARQARRRKAS